MDNSRRLVTKTQAIQTTKYHYPEGFKISVMYSVFTTVFLVLGSAIAFGLSFFTFEKYQQGLHFLADRDLGFLYLGIFPVKIGMLLININLGSARKESKVNVPDQQVYKVHTPAGQDPLGYVLMEQDGVIGQFNRAQRALMNQMEALPLFLFSFVLAGFVCPKQTFVVGTIWMILRVVYAVGYTRSASSRVAGGMLSNLLLAILDGFVIVAGIQAIVIAN